jgi:myo-inositol-hexaphosphate 3-phosphohydrolase
MKTPKTGRSWNPLSDKSDVVARAAASAAGVVAMVLAAAFFTLPSQAGAAAEPTVVGELQGEAMRMAYGSGTVVNESGVAALKLHSAGARATGTVTASAAVSGVRITARGTQCQGAPRIRILLNGALALVTNVASTTFTAYTSSFVKPAGTYTVTAKLMNNTKTAQCARTVSLDAVLLTGTSTPTTTTPPGSGSFAAFGSATVTADFLATGAGNNVDTIAFWEAPTPAESRMYVTSKNLSLVEVWKYPYASAADQQTPLTHSCLKASSDSATNGVLVDQESDLLYVASNFSPNVCVFSLPGLTHVKTITSGASYGLEPNLAMITLPTGHKRLYVSNNSIVYVHDPVTGAKLSQFTPTKGLEAMWGDNHDQVLYIPDENTRTGVYAYHPDGTPYTRNGKTVLGNSTIFDSDGEGIVEYTCPASGVGDDGTGLIVVSDQIDSSSTGNDYEVFDRRSWAYLGKIKMRLPTGGYVYNTDGIASTQQSSPHYPGGVLTAIHDDSSVAGVSWDKILRAISTQTGTTFGC